MSHRNFPLPTGLISASLLIGLVGCNQPPAERLTDTQAMVSPDASPAETATPTTAATPAAVAPSPAPEASLISASGIGVARLGMTLGELKQAIPDAEFSVKSPFMVDFDAIAVSQAGEVQFYILYLAGGTFSDNDVIQGLFTENSAYQTQEGVGPGTTLKQAATVYGPPTLSYNTQNESREYARFEQHPAPNLSFGTGNGNDTTAGIYAASQAEFNETKNFREDATIQSVLLICLAEGCAS